MICQIWCQSKERPFSIITWDDVTSSRTIISLIQNQKVLLKWKWFWYKSHLQIPLKTSPMATGDFWVPFISYKLPTLYLSLPFYTLTKPKIHDSHDQYMKFRSNKSALVCLHTFCVPCERRSLKILNDFEQFYFALRYWLLLAINTIFFPIQLLGKNLIVK